jgi:hypothetical protein
VLRARAGGPFAGYAESPSFSLWGCSAFTPVEGAFFAVADGNDCVTLRWTVDSLGGILGFHVYRALDENGPFERINDAPLPPASPGTYEDREVWPGTTFWYELRADKAAGPEETVNREPVSVRTTGELRNCILAVSPNPFSEQTTLHYDVASPEGARLVIYDVSGRVVRSLKDRYDRPGRYTDRWDGRNDAGLSVASGVYFCSLETEPAGDRRSVVRLR